MIKRIKSRHMTVAEKFGDLVILRKNLYTGEKIKAKTNASTIESRIGLRTKKERIKRTTTTNPYKMLFK